MALYRYIELAEHVFRDVPRNESEVLFLAFADGGRQDSYLLQRGQFAGDVWWDTPDGQSVFNRFRIAGMQTQCCPVEEWDDEGHSYTAQTLAIPFQGAKRFLVAGSFGCASRSKYIRAYEWTSKDSQDAFPKNHDSQIMLRRVKPTEGEVKVVNSAIEGLRNQADDEEANPSNRNRLTKSFGVAAWCCGRTADGLFFGLLKHRSTKHFGCTPRIHSTNV